MAIIKTDNPVPLLCLDIEIAVAKHFDYRQHVIVPNVSWGLGFSHEIDVLVMTRSGYVTEIEIKTSRADLKRDLLKRHQHVSSRIQRHFLAVPKAMVAFAIETFPSPWGVLSVCEDSKWVGVEREAKKNKDAKALSVSEINHLYELASMRIWTLKETLAGRIKRERVIIASMPIPEDTGAATLSPDRV
jgi:hypothetical protein